MDRITAIASIEYVREKCQILGEQESPHDFFGTICEALSMAIEALEKQIPKKPELKGEYYVCPVCGVYQETSEGKPPYCINCGQRLLWEIEENEI